MSNSCGAWYEGDTLLENYHENEWCKVSHDDRFQFEMLCLEGASTGLSWKTIMHRRNAYKAAFNNFSIERCATMTDEALEELTLWKDCFNALDIENNSCTLELEGLQGTLVHFTDGEAEAQKLKHTAGHTG